ncbi:MAG TPA: rhamnogalacturonan acetylesterase, partial [Tepidisphaeraceae bacterium]
MHSLLLLVAAFVLLCVGFSEAAEPERREGQPTVWLVGDSTVKNGTKGQQGWGDPFIELFDENKVRVINRARGGRSSRTFQTEGLWDAVLKESKPGDFVLIQMGHNDSGAPFDETRSRGSIRGTGEETVEGTHKDGRKEVVHTYGWYLRKYVADAREKGMTPIICSYVPRCPKPTDTIEADPAPNSYRLWAKETAEKENVPFIDLWSIIWKKYAGMKPEEIKSTYFSE